MQTEIHDPYRRCEDTCTHDLALGATASDLRDGDGPYPNEHPLFTNDPVLRLWIQRRLDSSITPT